MYGGSGVALQKLCANTSLRRVRDGFWEQKKKKKVSKDVRWEAFPAEWGDRKCQHRLQRAARESRRQCPDLGRPEVWFIQNGAYGVPSPIALRHPGYKGTQALNPVARPQSDLTEPELPVIPSVHIVRGIGQGPCPKMVMKLEKWPRNQPPFLTAPPFSPHIFWHYSVTKHL